MQMQLGQLIKNQMFEGYLLVRSAEQRTSSNGSKFLDLNLCDISMEINGKLWDGTVPPPKAGDVIKVRALMQEYNGRPQLRVDKLRAVENRDEVDMSALVPCAPQPADEMLEYIQNRVAAIQNEKLRQVVQLRLTEAGAPLLYYPAAQRLHHAERAGLLHHTSTMLRLAEAVCPIYPQLDADLLAAGIVLHDLCKLSELKADPVGIASEYTREGQLLGHLVQGVSELNRACDQVGVKGELRHMLAHMIISHHDLPEFGSPRRPMFPEAEVLHILDLMDARMFEMDAALKSVQPGGFSEKIWSLERRLYRREGYGKE